MTTKSITRKNKSTITSSPNNHQQQQYHQPSQPDYTRILAQWDIRTRSASMGL